MPRGANSDEYRAAGYVEPGYSTKLTTAGMKMAQSIDNDTDRGLLCLDRLPDNLVMI